MSPDQAPIRQRIRLPREERIEMILDVAIKLIGKQGFHGLSLKKVAEQAGLSEAGLIHYIRTKEGLLQLVIERRYDRRFDPEDFIATIDPNAAHPEGASFPAYLRYLVKNNAQDTHLMRLYCVLAAESTSPDHPAYEYFHERPKYVKELYARTRWRIPQEIGGWEHMFDLVELAIAAMDGIQIRFFRTPAIDLPTEWLKFEKILFPSPLWDDYR